MMSRSWYFAQRIWKRFWYLFRCYFLVCKLHSNWGL